MSQHGSSAWKQGRAAWAPLNSIRKAIRSLAQLTSIITKKLNLEFSSSVAVGLSGLITREGNYFYFNGWRSYWWSIIFRGAFELFRYSFWTDRFLTLAWVRGQPDVAFSRFDKIWKSWTEFFPPSWIFVISKLLFRDENERFALHSILATYFGKIVTAAKLLVRFFLIGILSRSSYKFQSSSTSRNGFAFSTNLTNIVNPLVFESAASTYLKKWEKKKVTK